MKPISYALAVVLVLAMGWVFLVAPPCSGNYALQLGGDEYFLFTCKDTDRSEHNEETVVISMPGSAEIYGGDLIITTSSGSTPSRVSIVVSSPAEGQLGGWTKSRGNELATISTEDFSLRGKKLFIHVKELANNQVTLVIGSK